MHNILKYLFIVSAAVFVMSGLTKDRLPNPDGIVEELLLEPYQEEVEIEEFTTERKGIVYTVNPLYEYDIYGLVVSYSDARGFLNISHKRWGDYLNIKDLCLIWGQNLRTPHYKKFKFTSRDWMCLYRTKDNEAYFVFRSDKFSNNHLLVDDEALKKLVRKTRRGDQVHISGYLSKYSHDGGFSRGTSTTRLDSGNGACETIYVTGFEILKRSRPALDILFAASGIAAASSALAIIAIFFVYTGAARKGAGAPDVTERRKES